MRQRTRSEKKIFWVHVAVFQENPDIDIGKRKTSSKVVNLLKRIYRYKEELLKFLFTTQISNQKSG